LTRGYATFGPPRAASRVVPAVLDRYLARTGELTVDSAQLRRDAGTTA